jgi:uncharacterized phage protein gp47/JayE
MPIIRPSYNQISSSGWTDFTTALGVPVQAASRLGSLGRALFRAIDNGYHYIDSLFKNSIPWTATSGYSDGWAALWAVYRKQAASAGPGSALFVVNGAVTIPAGSIFSGQNSVIYTSNADAVATAAGTLVVSTLTTEQTGSITNLSIGSAITLNNTIPNVVNAGTIISMTGGTDKETDAALNLRAQQARSAPPHGGGTGDYISWAEACPNVGVTRTWISTGMAPYGQVIVFICIDDGLHTWGIPNGTNGTSTTETRGGATFATGDQLAVANYIYQPYQRPATAFVQVYGPSTTTIAVTVQTSYSPSAPPVAMQSAALAAIQSELVSIGTPLGQTIYESALNTALVGVIPSYNLTIPTSSVTIPYGSLPVVSSIAWS